MSVLSLYEKRKINEESKSIRENVANSEDRQIGSKLRVTGVREKTHYSLVPITIPQEKWLEIQKYTFETTYSKESLGAETINTEHPTPRHSNFNHWT